MNFSYHPILKPCMLLCVLLMASAGFSQKKTKAYPLVHIGGLNKSRADTIRIKAYVIDIYICPPCPEGMICKPCNESNFTAAEEEKVDILKIPPEKRLVIFTLQSDSVKVGKRYLFTVRFRNKKGNPGDNVEMISFKQL